MDLPAPGFLREISHEMLQELELAARNRAANLSKMLRHELDSWVQQEAIALVARWFMEHRTEILAEALPKLAPKSVELFEVRDRSRSA